MFVIRSVLEIKGDSEDLVANSIHALGESYEMSMTYI